LSRNVAKTLVRFGKGCRLFVLVARHLSIERDESIRELVDACLKSLNRILSRRGVPSSASVASRLDRGDGLGLLLWHHNARLRR
jgi:hypothetical protein